MGKVFNTPRAGTLIGWDTHRNDQCEVVDGRMIDFRRDKPVALSRRIVSLRVIERFNDFRINGVQQLTHDIEN